MIESKKNRAQTYRCRGDPEGLVLQLLDHVSLDLGGGERVVDAAVLQPHARLLGAGPGMEIFGQRLSYQAQPAPDWSLKLLISQ